jgi:hypothetical protein
MTRPRGVVQPFAVFAFSAILVSLCAVFLYLGRGVLMGNETNGLNLPKPIIMTVSAVVLIGVFFLSLFIGREVIFPDSSVRAAVGPAVQTENTPSSSRDLEELRAGVDQAADSVYQGLETTKERIGKTEARKQAIEQGRDRAHDKLTTLADDLQKAAEENQPLPTSQRRAAEHLTEGVN